MTLTEYMDRLNLTDTEMARRLGVSISGLGKWKNGRRHPSPRHMIRIRNATSGVVTPDDFLPEKVAAE